MNKIELLEILGLERKVTLCLLSINTLKEATSKQIEKAAGLKQPEVSKGLRTLMECDFIYREIIKKRQRGRPQNVYHMKKSAAEIVKILEKRNEKEFDRKKRAAEDLYSLF